MRKKILVIDPTPEIIFLLKFICAPYTTINKKVLDNDHILYLCKKHKCELFIHIRETIKFGRVYDEITDLMEFKLISCEKKNCLIGSRYFMIFEEMNNLFLDFFGISSSTVADIKYCLVFSNSFIKIYDLKGIIIFNMQFELVNSQLMEIKNQSKEKNVEVKEYNKVGRIYVPMQDLKAIRIKKGHKIETNIK
ncbi:hypothetical protein DMUE_1759 [Dictyocoela muelleri]|nr:hypothetical protein DMUE_1759 [Dictyocoela muelleri]